LAAALAALTALPAAATAFFSSMPATRSVFFFSASAFLVSAAVRARPSFAAAAAATAAAAAAAADAAAATAAAAAAAAANVAAPVAASGVAASLPSGLALSGRASEAVAACGRGKGAGSADLRASADAQWSPSQALARASVNRPDFATRAATTLTSASGPAHRSNCSDRGGDGRDADNGDC
jgi:hypothetical protein